jgi:hypothetical protein
MRITCAGVFAVLLAGCQAPPGVPAPPVAIVPGQTTRQDLLLGLGDPIGTYEQEQVVVWRVATDAAGEPVFRRQDAYTGQPYRHELVVVFGRQGAVERFNTVRVLP